MNQNTPSLDTLPNTIDNTTGNRDTINPLLHAAMNFDHEDSQASSNLPDSTDLGSFSYGCSKSVKSKNITLDLLIRDGVLQPANQSLSVKYLGVVRTADLLENGRIRSNDTGELFSTPSAWAISCKKSINPAKTSGCGWGSIRYKGKSLDLYKSKWMKENMSSDSTGASPLNLTPAAGSRVSTPKLEPSPLLHMGSNSLMSHNLYSSNAGQSEPADVKPINPTDMLYPSMSALPLADYDKHMPTQVRCDGTEFSLKAIFSRSVCVAMAEMSCSSSEEISGYLSGSFNPLLNLLRIKNVYNKTDAEARTKVARSGEVLVGWFHSHPTKSYYPSVYDVECHMNYQLRLRDQPIVSCIVGQKHTDDESSLSMMVYTVSPPKLKFSERFGCLSDKCGKPKKVHWSLEPDTDTASHAHNKVREFMENLLQDIPS